LADKTGEDLHFWINCFGAAVLVVDDRTLKIREGNYCAAGFFYRARESFPDAMIGDVIGSEAEQMLSQVWGRYPSGIASEAFIINALVNDEQRLLMVRLTRITVERQLLRLLTFTDAPPRGSVALAGWQDNMLQIMNWFPFGFEIADHDDQIHFANAHCRELFGYQQHELESIEDWWRLAYPDPAYRAFAKHKWYTELDAARAENREMTPFDLDVTTSSGSVRTIQLRHRTIGNFNVNLFTDVTRERAYEKELKMFAATDPLTGVLNRRQFFEDMAPLFAPDAATSCAVLVLDIDHFKTINDTYGHATGDLVLQELTRRCIDLLSPNDRLARLGGEEFAVLLPGTAKDSAAAMADDLRKAVERMPFSVQEYHLPITISIGGASCQDGDTVDDMMLRADRALYDAKHAGRNRSVMTGA